MPIASDDKTRAMLADGRISTLTLDTSIFDEKHLHLDSKTLGALAGLKGGAITFVLSDTVRREVLGHLTKAAQEALRSAKKEIGNALFAFGTEKPTRDELIEQISGGRSATETARERLNKYLDDAGCEVLKDTELVSLSTVFDGYFAGSAPFGMGRKKDEFPDALALHALERTAADRDTGILIVSKDGDWRAYCAESQRLYLMPDIERALALIVNAPVELRRKVHRWLVEHSEPEREMWREIAHNVEQVDFTADACATRGEVTIGAWAGQLKNIAWPDEADLDIIEVERSDDDGEVTSVVVSVPLDLAVTVQVDLDFSLWDGIDKEYVGMGSHSIEVEQDMQVAATISLDIFDHGGDREEIRHSDSELDTQRWEIDLGEVDPFDAEDYRGD